MNRRTFIRGGLAGLAVLSSASLRAALAGGPKTLVIGATKAGCEAALADPDGVILLDRGILPAIELGVAETDAWATKLFKANCRVLLNAEIEKVAKTAGGFAVTAHGTDGVHVFEVAAVRDCTPAGWTAVGTKPSYGDAYDVVVAGLGSGGFYAAEKSALLGLRTLGVERMSEMGGQATIGCVCGTEENCRARLAELERRAKKAGFDRAMETTVIGVLKEGRTVVGVRLLANGAVREVRAKVVIDATGNAAVSRMAGCTVRIGRMSDGGQAAVSKASIYRVADGKTRMGYGFYRDNAECEGEAFSHRILGYAANDVRTLGGRTIVRKSPLMGAREEGHVDCEDTYTLRDAIVARRVDNPIFSLDKVPNDLVRIDADWAWENEDTVIWKEICELHNFAYHADMPYGAIVPRGVDGLLEAGKHYGVAHDAGGGLRMQVHMRHLGVAAAAAAKVSIVRGCRLKDVPYAELRPLLDDSAFRPRKYVVNSYYRWQFEDFGIPAVLKALKRPRAQIGTWVQRCERGDAEEAAWAYFTCWRTHLVGTDAERRALADALAAELDDAGGEHLAIALGLLRDTRGVARLVACAKGTGDYHDRIKALASLRILRAPEAKQLFASILADDAVAFAGNDAPGTQWGFARETRDYRRFLALSYAIFGLRELGTDVSTWRARPLRLPCGARDNADLAPQLKILCHSCQIWPG